MAKVLSYVGLIIGLAIMTGLVAWHGVGEIVWGLIGVALLVHHSVEPALVASELTGFAVLGAGTAGFALVLQTDEVTSGLVTENGTQESILSFPHLDKAEIFAVAEIFYKDFYFRSTKMAPSTWDMCRDGDVMKRQFREGVEFFKFPWGREEAT